MSDFELTDDFKINPAHIRFHFNKLKVFVHDVSRSERTKIRVQTFPIKLSESMIIQVGMNNFLKVKMI